VTAALTPGVFSPWIDGVVVYVAAIERRTGRIKDAMVADDREEARPRTIFASRGRLVTDDEAGVAHFLMRRGTILENESVRSYDRTDFKTFELNVSLATEAAEAGSEIEEPRRLQWGALLESRRRLVARGETAVDLEIEIQRRLAVSFVCVLLPLIAVPLGVQPARSSRSRGVVVALGVISAYYFLLTTAVTLVHKQLVGVVPALWAPNAALLLAGCAALWRAATERSHEGRHALRRHAGGAGA
jgi:lipopolysaccharide export LptBFGC system permease protein LptF